MSIQNVLQQLVHAKSKTIRMTYEEMVTELSFIGELLEPSCHTLFKYYQSNLLSLITQIVYNLTKIGY